MELSDKFVENDGTKHLFPYPNRVNPSSYVIGKAISRRYTVNIHTHIMTKVVWSSFSTTSPCVSAYEVVMIRSRITSTDLSTTASFEALARHPFLVELRDRPPCSAWRTNGRFCVAAGPAVVCSATAEMSPAR